MAVKPSRKAAAAARRSDEQRRRLAGLVVRYVSDQGYRAYVGAKQAARQRRGLLHSEADVYHARQRWQRGVARKVNRTIVEALLSGLVGLTATLVLPPGMPGLSGPSQVGSYLKVFAAILGRFRRRARKAGIRVELTLWAAEPLRSGLPHWNLTILVASKDLTAAEVALRQSVHPVGRGQAPRLASARTLKVGAPLTRADVGRRQCGVAYPFLPWIWYSLKARVWSRADLLAKGHADLLQFESWAHANGIARTLAPPLKDWATWQARRSAMAAIASASAATRRPASSATVHAPLPALPSALPVTPTGAPGTPSKTHNAAVAGPSGTQSGSGGKMKTPKKTPGQKATKPRAPGQVSATAQRTRRYRQGVKAGGKQRIEVAVAPDLVSAVRGVAKGELIAVERPAAETYAESLRRVLRELEESLLSQGMSGHRIRQQLAQRARSWRPVKQPRS